VRSAVMADPRWDVGMLNSKASRAGVPSIKIWECMFFMWLGPGRIL